MRTAAAVGIALSFALPALADEGAYQAIVGPGVSVRSVTPQVSPEASVLVESIYGLTDRWNWEVPVWADFLSHQLAVSLGLGAEFVWLRVGHLRCNVGAGALGALDILPRVSLQLGPYLETAVRWKIIWGLGVGLEVHAGYRWSLDGSGSAPFASAVLAVSSEL